MQYIDVLEEQYSRIGDAKDRLPHDKEGAIKKIDEAFRIELDYMRERAPGSIEIIDNDYRRKHGLGKGVEYKDFSKSLIDVLSVKSRKARSKDIIKEIILGLYDEKFEAMHQIKVQNNPTAFMNSKYEKRWRDSIKGMHLPPDLIPDWSDRVRDKVPSEQLLLFSEDNAHGQIKLFD